MLPKLFSPLQIKTLQLKNRIVVSPMCQYSADDGFANNWHLVHLGSRAIGGAAMIIQEATAVSPEGRITHGDLGIWKDDHIKKLREITHFISDHDCIPGIQLAHAGRKASITKPWEGNQKLAPDNGGYQTVAPSAIGYHDDGVPPIALDDPGIQNVISDFRAAAKRAVEAGYKVLELHGAHGYLIHQFFSPLTNQRNDNYGGSFENRIRFLLEIITAVQKEWPAELPLVVRISATDWAIGGWNIVDSIRLARILKEKGVDVIDVSSGGLVSHQEIPIFPGYQVPFAEQIKREAGIITGAVGLITTSAQAEAILSEDKADLIFFARESLRNPNLALTFAHELSADIKWPNQYERAKYEQ
ncbi:MAG TPA: NADH:flavin oxidoreductase/NADH oxidase [Flavobacterium sp.]|jgi:2,4-dienoyl-CoA reductase-like NADH-dependent reductase (Old Yellow Enzyme family)